MFDGIRLKVGLMYTRFHFRKVKDPVIRFTESVSRARRALVVLPDAPRDIASVQWIVRALAERFAEGTMTVIVRSDLTTWVKGDGHYQVMTYDRKDITAWFVPRQGLLGRMKRSTFDVALDLNTSFVLPGAFLCRESKAPLRVSFAKSYADEFYNLQVQTKSLNSLALAYRNLLHCLEMF